MESRERMKQNNNKCEKWKKKKNASKNDGEWNVRSEKLFTSEVANFSVHTHSYV